MLTILYGTVRISLINAFKNEKNIENWIRNHFRKIVED